MNTNDNCDGAGPHTEGEVRLLPIGHGPGGPATITPYKHFCRTCFQREKTWRFAQNKSGRNFPVIIWDEMEVYPKPDVAQEQARMRRTIKQH